MPNIIPFPDRRLGRLADPYWLARHMPELFANYLRATFRRPEEVATAYTVTFATARNWWDAVSAPRADKVAATAVADPEGFERHIAGPIREAG